MARVTGLSTLDQLVRSPCELLRRAYERFNRLTSRYEFDEAAVMRVVRLLSAMPNTRGMRRGRPIELQPWQVLVIAQTYGLRVDGRRLTTHIFASLPRKNGKTTFAAGLCLAEMVMRPGASIGIVAPARQQSALTLQQLRDWCAAVPALRARAKLSRTVISYDPTGAHVEALGGDRDVVWGRNLSCVVVDELHAFKNRTLYDGAVSSLGAHSEPLTVVISTAGQDRESLYTELREQAREVLEGDHEADHVCAVVATRNADTAWDSDEAYIEANPGLGVTVTESDLRQARDGARLSPGAEHAYRVLRLNESHLYGAAQWLPGDLWMRAIGPEPPGLADARAVASIDMSATRDLTCIALAWRLGEIVYAHVLSYAPQGAVERGQRSLMYRRWLAGHHLRVMPGDYIQPDLVAAELIRLASQYRVRAVFLDPWGARGIVPQLTAAGLRVIEQPMGARHQEPLIRAVEELVYAGRLRIPNDPVLLFALQHVQVEQGTTGRRLVKPTEHLPIDPAVAMVMAVGHVDTQLPGEAIVMPEIILL